MEPSLPAFSWFPIGSYTLGLTHDIKEHILILEETLQKRIFTIVSELVHRIDIPLKCRNQGTVRIGKSPLNLKYTERVSANIVRRI